MYYGPCVVGVRRINEKIGSHSNFIVGHSIVPGYCDGLVLLVYYSHLAMSSGMLGCAALDVAGAKRTGRPAAERTWLTVPHASDTKR